MSNVVFSVRLSPFVQFKKSSYLYRPFFNFHLIGFSLHGLPDAEMWMFEREGVFSEEVFIYQIL